GGHAEEEVVDHILVVEGDGVKGLWDGEDHMEVLHGQEFGSALFQPASARQPLALGTMPVTTGTVLNVGEVAVVAPFDGAAQDGGAAGFNGPHQTMLMQGQGMGLAESGTVLAKDVGQLQSGCRHYFVVLRPPGLGLRPRRSRGLAVAATS